MAYFPLEDVFLTGQLNHQGNWQGNSNDLILCTTAFYHILIFAGLVVNRTGLMLNDLTHFLTDKNLSHAFRGGIDYVSYHGLNATSMQSFWARYLEWEVKIQN